MRRAVRHLIGILACALVVAGVTAGSAQASAPHRDGAVQPLAATSFYRLWHPADAANPKDNDHFHTTDWNEVITAAQLGYQYEGIRGYVYPASSNRGLPFYRLYNPTNCDHFHTTELAEVSSATQQGYQLEGIRARVL